MAAITNILVPTDFSESSTRALRYACALADAFGASLHLLHVGELPYPRGGYLEYYPPPPELSKQVQREAMKRLNDALTDDEKRRYGALLIYRPGSPAEEILKYLELQQSVDLVVMGTHGRRAMARLLMGSVAERVVRDARCPVLTIHASDGSSASASHAA